MISVNSLRSPERQAQVVSALKSVAQTGQFLEGAFVFRLEKMFSGMMRGASSIAFNSVGSAAYAMFKAYTRHHYRHVAIQNNSSIGVATMALQAGYRLYLVDSAADCPAMSADTLLRVLEDNPAIEMVVVQHVGGWYAKHYQDVANLCRDRSLMLVEDCTSILGVNTATASPGTLSDCSLWGFSQSSAIPAGNGGILVTNDPEIRNDVKLTRNMGRHLNGSAGYRYAEGFDLRMSEWDASVACVQLEAIPTILEARARDAAKLQSIAACLLSGPTNWEKYPVDPTQVVRKPHIPNMHSLEEQLAHALTSKQLVLPNLPNSTRWAHNHRCIPVGEGLYDSMNEPKDILEYLKSL